MDALGPIQANEADHMIFQGSEELLPERKEKLS